MQLIENPWRGTGIDLPDTPLPSTNAQAVAVLLAQCPAAGVTPLVSVPELADRIGVAQIRVKDERSRMGLGSFKALGAAYVIAHEAVATGSRDLSRALNGRCFATASAGNHGLSVAAGAAAFGARAVIYLSETVPEGFAERLRAKGAEVVRAGADYEASMDAAQQASAEYGWTLLSDSSWPGYMDLPHRLMEGYLAMAAEAAEQLPEPPTHVFLQAGVGGLAGACARYFRKIWGDEPRIIVVEPKAAPALHDSIRAGRVVDTQGPVSDMGRLDCKTPSMIALKGLSRDADGFALIGEDEARQAMPILAEAGLATTTSGGAGLAAALLSDLPSDARVLCILSEEPGA